MTGDRWWDRALWALALVVIGLMLAAVIWP